MQTDPIGYADDMNLYAYVGNNPINRTDPTGNCPSCLFGALAGGGLDLGIQLYSNGGDWSQVSWTSVGISAGLGAVGGGIASKMSTLSKLGEINQLTNQGRNLVTSGAAPKFTSSIGQNVTKAEANQLGQLFTGQGEQYLYRAPANKVKLGVVQANFESTITKASGTEKIITNIHATVTPLGTSVRDGIVGGMIGAAAK